MVEENELTLIIIVAKFDSFMVFIDIRVVQEALI